MCLIEVIAAAIRGSLYRANSTTPQLSAYTLKRGIIHFYVTHKLFPKGLRPEMPCVEDWALRCGVSLKRLVARSGKFGFHAILQVCSVHGELSLNEVQTSWIPTWKLACALKVARFRRLMKRAPCKSKTKQLGALKAFAVENSWPRPVVAQSGA